MNPLFSLRRFSFGLPALIMMVGVLAGPRDLGAVQSSDVAMRPDADASIRLAAINSNWDGLGWYPVVVRIENHAEHARTWEFEFNAGNAYNHGATVRTPVAIDVPARGMSETVVYVAGPGRSTQASAPRTAGLRVQVSGPGVAMGRVSGLNTSRELGYGQIAVSPRMEATVRGLVTASPSGRHHTLPEVEIESIDPTRWPADWRVWSSFPHIVLAQEEYDALDGARRNALREWVAQGGVLWLAPSGGQAVGEGAETSYGLGRIHHRLDTLVSRARVSLPMRVAPWRSVAELVTDEDRGEWTLDRPIVALIVFLVLFGIVVGPVNVFVFAPASRRQRLFLTVPALSVGASLLLGLVIVLKDGFGGAGVRRSLVVLLPGENKAAVFQQQVARTGVLLSKEFTLPADTLISVGSGGSTGVDGSREFERAGDTAAGAWFTSRATQAHDLRRITPTRARVELVDGGANGRAPVVQSSVTTVLRDFRYVDPAGNRWTADELPPGQRVTLSSTDTIDRGDVAGFFRAYGGATDLAPLNTHASIEWREETVIYTGRVEAARQP